MKRFVLCALLACGAWMAVADDALTVENQTGNYRRIVYNWTSNGSGEATGVTTVEIPGVLYDCTTTPGGGDSQPSDNYDITIKQMKETSPGTWTLIDVDKADGELQNRDNVNTELVDLTDASVKPVYGKLRIDVTNAGASKSGRIVLTVYAMQFAKRVGSVEELLNSGANGQAYVADGNGGGSWVDIATQQELNAASAGAPNLAESTLDDLGDASYPTSLADGHMLLWDSAAAEPGWVNKAMSGMATITKAGAVTLQGSPTFTNVVATTLTGSSGADLVIKPGSGRQLVLQDQGGTQKMWISGSGALVFSQSIQASGARSLGILDTGWAGLYLSNVGIIYEGTADANETTLAFVDPTADRTITFPNVTGTVVTTGDTGSVSATMLASNSVTSAKIQTDAVGADAIAANAVGASELASTTVSAGSYNGWLTVDADGRLTAAGTLTKPIILTASGGSPLTTGGCAVATKIEIGTNKRNVWVLDFDKDTDEGAFWNGAMPADYAGGTLSCKIYWTASTGSGAVVWNIAGRCFDDDDTLDAALGTAATVTDTLLSAHDMHIASTGALTLAGSPAAGKDVILEVKRDADNASDTFSADARLLKVVLEYVPKTS